MNDFNIEKAIKYSVSTILVLFVLYITGTILLHHNQYFLTHCPCRDVLSWDANLRLIGVMDQIQDLRSGRFFSGLIPLLDAPTWPPLRSVIALFVHGVNSTPPDTIYDVYISTVFFVLMIVALLPFAVSITNSPVAGSFIWGLSVFLIFDMKEMAAYTFSSMLETQGMFFLVIMAFYYYRITGGLENDSEQPKVKTVDKWGFFIGSFGLFMTKYPYGYIFIIAMTIAELVRYPKRYLDFSIHSWKQRYFGFRGILIALFVLVVIVMLATSKLGIHTPIDLKSKAFKNSVYLLLLILFVDFNLYLRKDRIALKNILPESFRSVYFYAIFPSLTWVLIHPDRVMSAVGTQQHQQDSSRSFLISFFMDVFDNPVVIILIALFFVLSLSYFLYERYIHKKTKELPPGLWSLLLFILLQFVVLDLVTGNKQLRHLYHLIPGVLPVILALIYFMIYHLVQESKKFGQLVFGAPVLVLMSVLMASENFATESNFYRTHEVCFTGKDESVFSPARWYADQLETDKKYILMNHFHSVGEDVEGRHLASEFDLLMRMTVYKKGDLRNDSPYSFHTWKGYDRLLVLYSECENTAVIENTRNRANQVQSNLQFIRDLQYENGPYCMREYEILPL